MEAPRVEASPWEPPRAPTGPAAGLRYAGFWIRVAAFLVDVVALVGICTLLWWLTGAAFFEVRTTQFQNGNFSGMTFSVNLTPWSWLIVLVYFVGSWGLRGQTPGMLAFEMRILGAADGRPIGLGRAIVRFIAMVISFAVLLIGVIWVAADSRKQGWHDKIARTVVVGPSAEPQANTAAPPARPASV